MYLYTYKKKTTKCTVSTSEYDWMFRLRTQHKLTLQIKISQDKRKGFMVCLQNIYGVSTNKNKHISMVKSKKIHDLF